MSQETTEHPVLAVVKQQAGTVVTRHGVRGKFIPVPYGLIQDALSQVKRPKVPVVFLEDKGREEENPFDPDYQEALSEYTQERARVSTEVLCMFGIELLDPVPVNGTWTQRLKLMEKRGTLDLNWVDWNDKVDLEFLFKRYIWSTTSDLGRIQEQTGISPEAVGAADDNF